jgi:hypothetical protein
VPYPEQASWKPWLSLAAKKQIVGAAGAGARQLEQCSPAHFPQTQMKPSKERLSMFALDPEVNLYLLCTALQLRCSCEVSFCKHAQRDKDQPGGTAQGTLSSKRASWRGARQSSATEVTEVLQPLLNGGFGCCRYCCAERYLAGGAAERGLS